MIPRFLTKFMKISKDIYTILNRVGPFVLTPLISAQMDDNLKISVTVLVLCFHFFIRLQNATEADES